MDSPLEAEILQLLSEPAATFMCLTDDGSPYSPLPQPLHKLTDQLIDAEIPLEIFAKESQADTVATFVNCLLTGTSSTTTQLVDGEYRSVHFFDGREAWDCVVAVTVPTSETKIPSLTEKPNYLPVRRALSKLSISGHSLWIDQSYTQMMGYSWDEYVGANTSTFVHPDDLERSQVAFAELLRRPGGQTRLRMRVRHRDGHWVWVELTRTNNLHTDEPHILNETVDLSEEMAIHTELEARKALLAQLTESLPLGVLHLTPDGRVSLKNQRWVEMTGVEPRDDLATLVASAFAEPDVVLQALNDAAEVGLDVNVPVRFTSPTLGKRSGMLRQQLVRSPEPQKIATTIGHQGTLLTLDDITSTVDFQTQLEQLARTDHLTKSLNRLGIEEQITWLLDAAKDDEQPLHLLYFDLDDFKLINDQFGHSAGDEILQAVADSIRAAVRPDDVVGRLGGDEFVAVLRSIDATNATAIAARVQDHLQETVGIATAVGIAAAEPSDDFDAFVSRADQRMYTNKRRNQRKSPYVRR